MLRVTKVRGQCDKGDFCLWLDPTGELRDLPRDWVRTIEVRRNWDENTMVEIEPVEEDTLNALLDALDIRLPEDKTTMRVALAALLRDLRQ